MTKRFYIDVTFTGFNGKLSIDIDAGSEKQAWEVVDTMLSGRLYQLKTTHTVNLPSSGYIGKGEHKDREAKVYPLAHNNWAAQAITDGGRTTFRLGEFETEEQAERACEDYVMGVQYD